MEQEKQAIAKIRLASGPDAFRRYRAQEKLSRWEVTLNILRHGHVANVHVADAFQASMPVIS